MASSSAVVIPGPYGGAQQLEGLADEQAGHSHEIDLFAALDLDAAIAEGHGASGSALGDDVEGVEDARRDLVDLAQPVDLDEDAPARGRRR